MSRRHTALAALAAGLASAALALTAASGMPGLIDPDGFSHIAYARRLWESGLSLRGHPFLPFSVLAESGVDPWWGFHWLLLPFLPLGDLWGARAAGAVIAGVSAAALVWAMARLAPKAPWWLALLPLTVGSFVIRFQSARPGTLSAALLLVELVAGAGLCSPLLALLAALVHAQLHLSAPISPLFALLGFLGARLGGEKGSSRAWLWSIGGVGLGLLLRPDTGPLLAEGLAQTLRVFGVGQARLPHSSVEVSERGPWLFWLESWPLLLLLLLAFVAGALRGRAGGRAAIGAAALGAALSCAMMIFASRFVDYGAPFLVLLIAALWPGDGPLFQRSLAVASALLFALQAPRNLSSAWEIGHHFYDQPESYQQLAAAVRRSVPPGEILFTDDAWVAQILLSALPEYRYLVAYDPALLYLSSPIDFWRWHHAIVDGIDCPAEACSGMRPSGAAVARVLADFDARYAITSLPHMKVSMQEVMARDATRFDLVESAPGQAYGLYLWRVHPAAKGAR